MSVDARGASSCGDKDDIEARDILPGCCTLAGIGVGAASMVIGGMNAGRCVKAGVGSSNPL